MGTRKSGQVLLPLPLGQVRPPGIHRARCASPGPGKRGSLGPYPTSAPSTAAHRPLHAPLRSHHLLPAYPLLRRPPRFDHLLVRACSSPLPRRSAPRDLDPLLGRFAARLRHPDLQYAVAVGGRDNLRSGALGQSDLAYEASVSEFGAVALVRLVLPLLAALCLDGQHSVIDGDVNVPLRVDAGQFGSDDDVILIGELLHLDGRTCQRLLASREPAEVLERPARQQFAEMARPARGGEWLLGSERGL